MTDLQRTIDCIARYLVLAINHHRAGDLMLCGYFVSEAERVADRLDRFEDAERAQELTTATWGALRLLSGLTP